MEKEVNQTCLEYEEKLGFLCQSLEKLQQKYDHLQDSMQSKDSASNSREILIRIELEKARELFQKEKRQLQLQVCDLEERIQAMNQ